MKKSKGLQRVLSVFALCGLFIVFTPILAEDSKDKSFPSELIKDGDSSACIYLPDTENGFYRGTRFDLGSMIGSFRVKDNEFFTEWHHPDTHPEINCGAGPSEEFDFGLDGTTIPQGYDEAKIGEAFLKIGVGWLKKSADKPYISFFPFEVLDAGKWQIERQNSSSIRIIHSTDPTKKYAYRLTRTITVKAEPPSLIIERELTNTGKTSIETSHYSHNFISLNKEVVGPNYNLILPFKASFANSVPEYWSLTENIIVFKDFQKVLFGVNLLGIEKDTKNSFAIVNLKSGQKLLCDGDYRLFKFNVFAGITAICPEPFVIFSLSPGESFKWKTTYRCINLNLEKD